jgi:hypothetical protein
MARTANGNAGPASQIASSSLDLDKFSRIVGRLGSDHEGERSNAVTLGSRMLEAAGMRWEDFIQAYPRAEIATAAAAELLAENTALKAELDQLRRTGTAVALWQEVGAKISDTRTAALWALDLHHRGQVYLSPNFEFPFLKRCTTWTGRLTPKMQPIFQRIMDTVVERTGQTPPAS